MEIKGFLRNSFVDWDGKITSVIFLPGCTFRCGYCYNRSMVMEPEKIVTIDFNDIKDHLEKNKGFIDGVVITGGEPTFHSDLPELVDMIKSLGYPVKLDTNGSNPDMLEKIISGKMVDYIAMDIKAPLERYSEVAGVVVNTDNIKRSIELIRNSGIDYEFRTTIIPSIHGESEIEKIADEIRGAKKYALQRFIARENIDPKFMNELSPTNEYMEKMKAVARKHVKGVIIRD